jgi:hypothetical protein
MPNSETDIQFIGGPLHGTTKRLQSGTKTYVHQEGKSDEVRNRLLVHKGDHNNLIYLSAEDSNPAPDGVELLAGAIAEAETRHTND